MKPKRQQVMFRPDHPEFYDADDIDAWLRDEVLPVLREMREWVGELHTGIAGVAVMAVYESGKLDALIEQLEDTHG